MSLAVVASIPRQRRAGGLGYRAPNEFYPTPFEATRALLSVEHFEGPIWEPACGDGAISKVLIDAGHEVTSSDLIGYGYAEADVDFLQQETSRAKHIVTNPPYGFGLADRFAEHALQLTAKTGGSVAMLLNLSSLCHPTRHAFWLRHPPAVVYALDALDCWPCGNPALTNFVGGKHRYCWVVWKPDHVGPTRLAWLSPSQFR